MDEPLVYWDNIAEDFSFLRVDDKDILSVRLDKKSGLWVAREQYAGRWKTRGEAQAGVLRQLRDEANARFQAFSEALKAVKHG